MMTSPAATLQLIEQRLRKQFSVSDPTLLDDSAQHAGHPGAMLSGGGHYKLTLVSPDFAHRSAVERHRQIYAVLGDLIGNAIHAINIEAKTPEEWAKMNTTGESAT